MRRLISERAEKAALEAVFFDPSDGMDGDGNLCPWIAACKAEGWATVNMIEFSLHFGYESFGAFTSAMEGGADPFAKFRQEGT